MLGVLLCPYFGSSGAVGLVKRWDGGSDERLADNPPLDE